MSHLYPRQCDERPFLAVSNLAFRRHLLTHHHILLEMRDGREEFRRLPPDEAAHRCQVVRGRRRGRQRRAQAEAAYRRPSPAVETATRRPSPDNRTTNYLPAGYLSDTSSDEFE